MADSRFVDMSTVATVAEAFEVIARRHPGKDCICIPARPGRDYAPDGLTWSYGEVSQRAAELRNRYVAAGYGHGHRIAILFENRPSFMLHWLALNAIGVGLVPINLESTAQEITTLLQRSHAVLVVALPHKRALVQQAVGQMEVPIPVVGEEIPHAFPPAITPRLDTAPNPLTEAGLLFTSGTTGVSKGAILTNEALLFNGHRYIRAGGVMEIAYGAERHYNPLPLSYANAFANSNIAMILSAGCMIFPDRFHPDVWWQDLIATDATIIHYLGIIAPLLLQRPPVPEETRHRIKFGLGAGADTNQHIAFEARFGFPLVEVYGMSELGISSYSSHEPRMPGLHLVGTPIEGVEYRLIDNNGQALKPGQAGELLVRRAGDNPRKGFFAGYLDDPELTEFMWRDGWYHTGDNLRQDDEGRYFWVDRLKDMVRRSGENISTAEVENCIRAHPAVSMVACVAAPDPLRQEEVVACIILQPGFEPSTETALSIMEWSLERIAYFRSPGGIVFMSEFPMTTSKKIQKHRIFAKGEDVFTRPDCIDLRHLKKQRTSTAA